MQYPFSWTLKKVQLARLVDAPINEWKYNYQFPGDMLGNPRAVFNTNAVGANPVRDFEIYSGGLFTNLEEVYIDYQFRPEPAIFPPYFVRLLKTALAAEFAEPITDQITKLSTITQGLWFAGREHARRSDACCHQHRRRKPAIAKHPRVSDCRHKVLE